MSEEFTPQQEMAVNQLANQLATVFGRGNLGPRHGFPEFSGDQKHPTSWVTYGYPSYIPFWLFYNMYERNGLARQMVDIRVDYTWSQFPIIATDVDNYKDDPLYKQVKLLQNKHNIWATMAELDRRQSVGRWAGAFLELKDNSTDLSEPTKGVNNMAGLQAIKVQYEAQLEPTMWVTDTLDPAYGTPRKYQLNENEIGDQDEYNGRSVIIDKSRVIVWAEKSTGAHDIYGESALKPGFNALLDYEKIRGAGGEGFWKNAKGMQQVLFEDKKGMTELQQFFGTKTQAEAAQMFSAAWDKFLQSFDAALSLSGAEAKPITISLENPEQFRMSAIIDCAASIGCPVTILIGQETGRLASDEDKNSWSNKITARREQFASPAIRKFIDHLMEVGVLDKHDNYEIQWPSMFEASLGDKAEVLDRLASAAQKIGGNIDMSVLAEIAGLEEDDIKLLKTMQNGDPGSELDEL